MKLACVVVFYNPTKKNILYLENYKDCVDKIYVIDNSDDKIIRIKETDKLKYIKLNKNVGIAKALNIGAELAINDGYNWLLTLDQDSWVTGDIINKMVNYIDDNAQTINIGLVSPYHNVHSGEDDRNGQAIEEKIEVMTSGNIINLDAYKKIGGFKNWLFIDCVDIEFGMNLNKNHYKVIRLNNIVMEHNLGNLRIHKFFGKKYPCYNHSPLRRYYMVRNTLYIRDLYYDLFKEHCDYLIRVQIGQVKRIIMFEKEKFKKLLMMYKGYKDYKKNIKGKYYRK